MKINYTRFTGHLKLVAILFASSLISFNSLASYSYKNARVPSLSADTAGIFVRISVPQYKRYSCGAPVVIYVNGGFGATGMLGNMFNISNYGFIVIEFNFPGGGSGTQKSGGVFDNRGYNSMMAIKDVIRFALGQTTDKTGKYLHQLTGTKNPVYSNVGIIGGSNGGCNLLAALGLYSEYFNSLAWVSFFESPIGDGMLTADPGKPYGHNVSIFKNNGYNDSTGIYNWDIFKFAQDSIAFKQGANIKVKGLFYFDVNNNNIFDRGIDFDVIGRYNGPYSSKYFYSQQIVQHAYQKGFYPLTNASNNFADSIQTKEYWSLRNGDNWIGTFMTNMPNLKVLFMVRDDSDHITSAPNHPEVLNTWNKFSSSGCSWFRVNSDQSYIQYVTGLTLPTAPDNNANTPLDNMNIRNMVMPGNIFADRYMNHYASSLEMADRVMNNNWATNLPGVLSVTCPAPSKEEEEISSDEQPILYPNPAINETYIQVNASEYGKSIIRVFDAIGREVLQPQVETVLKGFNLVILDINSLSAGNYFVRIDAPGVTHTLQFTRE